MASVAALVRDSIAFRGAGSDSLLSSSCFVRVALAANSRNRRVDWVGDVRHRRERADIQSSFWADHFRNATVERNRDANLYVHTDYVIAMGQSSTDVQYSKQARLGELQRLERDVERFSRGHE